MPDGGVGRVVDLAAGLLGGLDQRLRVEAVAAHDGLPVAGPAQGAHDGRRVLRAGGDEQHVGGGRGVCLGAGRAAVGVVTSSSTSLKPPSTTTRSRRRSTHRRSTRRSSRRRLRRRRTRRSLLPDHAARLAARAPAESRRRSSPARCRLGLAAQPVHGVRHVLVVRGHDHLAALRAVRPLEVPGQQPGVVEVAVVDDRGGPRAQLVGGVLGARRGLGVVAEAGEEQPVGDLLW